MTQAAVTRTLFAVITVLCVAALAFGVFVRRTSPTPEPSSAAPAAGEAAYATHCGSCHTPDFAVLYVRAAPTVERGSAALATLLRSHGNAPQADQAVIVAAVTAEARR